jgi:hypothetical protein
VLIALVLGLVRSSPALLVVALTTIVGGIALAGSSQGTWAALRTSIAERERLRTEIIDISSYGRSRWTETRCVRGVGQLHCEMWGQLLSALSNCLPLR